MKSIRRILFASALFVLAFVSCTKVVEVETVTVSQSTAQLSVGDKVQLYATVLPSNAVNKDITWASSNHRVATITESGMVEAVAKGICEITAMAGGVVGKCAVTVTEVTAQSVTLSAETLKLGLGQTEHLSATVKPDNVTDKTISWASDNEDVATVTSEGKVTGHNVGHASITATCGIVSGACSVTVSTIDVESVTLDKSSVEIYIGESATLTATVKPDNATNKEVYWSLSNSSTVYLVENNDGSVTINAFGEGWVTITAQAGDVKATCEVHVIIREVTSVTLSKTSLDLIVGQEETITAEVLPSNATYSSVSWKSTNTSVATVNNGKITALSEGATIISATAGGVTATCPVSVKEIKAESIVLNKTELALIVGDTFQLTAEIIPDNVTYKTITWKSSNPDIVQVDEGFLTALKEGESIITAVVGAVSAQCVVSVKEIKAEQIILNATSLTLKLGDTFLLSAEVYPDNVTNKTITWTSSSPDVASIDDTGRITTKQCGTTTISVSCAGMSVTCDIAVYDTFGLCFEAVETGNIDITNSNMQTLSYSSDGIIWTDDKRSSFSLRVEKGNNLYLRLIDGPSRGGVRIKCSSMMYISGNFLSMSGGTCMTFDTLAEEFLNSYSYWSFFYQNDNIDIHPQKELILPSKRLYNACYQGMFAYCTKLTRAPKLPAITLANNCYNGMFTGCTSLIEAPELPATTLAPWCYYSMFSDCTSLTKATELPATSLQEYCYSRMFQGCSSLEEAPSLPAKTLAQLCYSSMFTGCSSLITAPDLPAVTLMESCYSGMFSNCTSLIYAPKELPATSLVASCYTSMFYNCNSLKIAPVLPATTLANNCYKYMFTGCTTLEYIKVLCAGINTSLVSQDWVKGVSSSGTFVKKASANWPTGTSGIPTGWTVETVDE